MKHRPSRVIAFLIFALIPYWTSAQEPEPSAWSAAMSAGWDSRYVSEGRDNLDGVALVWSALEAGSGGALAGMWYGSSPDTDYDELELSVAYGMEFGSVALSAAYTWLSFLSDDEEDHELGLGAAMEGLPLGLVPSLDATWSAQAEGVFYELTFVGEVEPAPGAVVEPFVTFGVNQGYVADGHDGLNHVAAGLALSADLAETVAISGFIAYSWAVDADEARHPGDAGLDDFAYGGIAVTMTH